MSVINLLCTGESVGFSNESAPDSSAFSEESKQNSYNVWENFGYIWLELRSNLQLEFWLSYCKEPIKQKEKMEAMTAWNSSQVY